MKSVDRPACLKKEGPRVQCPYCGQIKDGFRLMANHLIAFHSDSPEAGAAHTSPGKRLPELLANNILGGSRPPNVYEREAMDENAIGNASFRPMGIEKPSLLNRFINRVKSWFR